MTGIVIYGLGGWNRYYVKGSGEIVLSARHASEASYAKASEVGLTTQGERQ